MMFQGLHLIQLVACGDKPSPIPVDTALEDTAVEEPSTEPSIEPEGTDADGDGFTIEDGDCDDTSPWINPARDEEAGDGVDNDCDGRIDEKWSGVTISLVKQGETSSLLRLNQIGNVESELSLSNDCTPTYLDNDLSTGGYVISHANTALATVSPTGECQVLVDYSEDEINTELLGVLALPSGDFVASRGNELIQVSSSGAVTSLSTWDANPTTEAGDTNPNFQLYVWSIARDLVSGEIALFGLFGGFATWHSETGLVVHRSIDPETWDGRYAYAGAAKDGGGWFSLLYESETSEISIAQFDQTTSDWQTRILWSDADQSAQQYAMPQGITINGDNGDYYVTADVATYSSVFRIREADEFIDDLYRSNSQPTWTFFGIVSNY
jgi:hypothetical protein